MRRKRLQGKIRQSCLGLKHLEVEILTLFVTLRPYLTNILVRIINQHGRYDES